MFSNVPAAFETCVPFAGFDAAGSLAAGESCTELAEGARTGAREQPSDTTRCCGTIALSLEWFLPALLSLSCFPGRFFVSALSSSLFVSAVFVCLPLSPPVPFCVVGTRSSCLSGEMIHISRSRAWLCPVFSKHSFVGIENGR